MPFSMYALCVPCRMSERVCAVCVHTYVCVYLRLDVCYVVGFRHCTGACWILLLILFFVFFWVLGDCTEDDIDNGRYYNRSMRMAFCSSCRRTHFTLLLHTTTPSSLSWYKHNFPSSSAGSDTYTPLA